MADVHNRSSLSSGDALFLYFEREGQPVNVASVNVFEGVVPLDQAIEFIQSRLPQIPRYRQRVAVPAYNVDLPAWEFDPEFDLRNHVREVVLRHGTETEFKAVAGQILSTTLDRKRPLWDFTLVHGLKGNRTGAVLRMHHCLADGIAGVGLLNLLMDPSPTTTPTKPSEPPPEPPRRSVETSLLKDLINSSASIVNRVLKAESELLDVAKQVVTGGEKQPDGAEANADAASGADTRISLLDELKQVLPEFANPPNRLPFNVVCRGPQKFNWAEVPLAEIKAVKQVCGATVNDVVLTIVTSAVRRYAELHDVELKGRLLRVIVPVNIRDKGQESNVGNRITFLPVDIPLDIADPLELIDAVRKAVTRARSARLAEFVGLLGTLLGAIPTAFQAVAGPVVSQLPLSLCNLICTNVPGPQAPLYFLGHRVLSCYPYVPIGGEMGMNCAVLTYDGTAYFGFTGDAHAVPDLKLLDKLLTMSFAELRKAASVPSPRGKSARTKVHAAPAPGPIASDAPGTAAAVAKAKKVPRPVATEEKAVSDAPAQIRVPASAEAEAESKAAPFSGRERKKAKMAAIDPHADLIGLRV